MSILFSTPDTVTSCGVLQVVASKVSEAVSTVAMPVSLLVMVAVTAPVGAALRCTV